MVFFFVLKQQVLVFLTIKLIEIGKKKLYIHFFKQKTVLYTYFYSFYGRKDNKMLFQTKKLPTIDQLGVKSDQQGVKSDQLIKISKKLIKLV